MPETLFSNLSDVLQSGPMTCPDGNTVILTWFSQVSEPEVSRSRSRAWMKTEDETAGGLAVS